jgi:hypothetical protein
MNAPPNGTVINHTVIQKADQMHPCTPNKQPGQSAQQTVIYPQLTGLLLLVLLLLLLLLMPMYALCG